jgi:hypothetical protein
LLKGNVPPGTTMRVDFFDGEFAFDRLPASSPEPVEA